MRLSKKIIFVDKLKDFLAPLFSFVKHSETKLGGQSTIEYSMVVMLVMAGIIVLGPYVIRSVNAHFKMWEDTTEEAFTDPLKDRDPEGLPKPQCRCPVEPTGCGLGSCQPTEMLWQKNCVPLDCEPQETRCEVQNGCCTEWEPAGACGQDGCPPDQMLKKQTCGKLPPKTACQPDGSCQNRCTGSQPDNTQKCEGDEVSVIGQLPWVPVDDCSPPEGRKCEAECLPGYVVEAGACVQPPPQPDCVIFRGDVWHIDIHSGCKCVFQCGGIPACPSGSREISNTHCPGGTGTCFDNVCFHGGCGDECAFRMCERLTAPDGGPCTPVAP